MSASPIRRRSLFAASAVSLSTLVFSLSLTGNALAHGVTFKLQHEQAENSALNQKFIAPWAQKIYDETGGRMNVLVTTGTDAAGPADLFQLAQDRDADMVWLTLPGLSGEFPRFGVFGTALPGATSTGSSQALWSWSDVNDLGFREFKELRVVAASRHDAPVFHMREKPVGSLADLQGLRIGIPNADGVDMLAALGASPVVMTGPEMRTALTDASADGVLLSWSSLAALGLADLVKTHASAPAGAPWAYSEVSALLLNPDAYRGLGDDLKQVIRANSGNDASAWVGKVFDETAAKTRQEAASRGATIATLPDSDLAAWNEAAEATISKRVEALNARKLRGDKTIAKARAIISEYDSRESSSP